ncbi:hypothetical protein [Chitinophaga sp. Cy-1792]|uniref:hypothetical protein n=1 Tax=Chitinophaga sp. Cy-1792 TaxID=2608339 RepID=UPI001421CFAB|nr:hypothetical protein [Chitinophaga sp. Cy-1792]NIG54987.1 hypothetical protein [Chitinophaga sp. Cy-1792]
MKFKSTAIRVAGIVLTVATFLYACKHGNNEAPQPIAPPLPSAGNYLVSAIYVNGAPKDSLIYNTSKQVTRLWQYVPFYRKFLNYVDFTYQENGYVKTADYQTYIGGNMLHTQKDSVALTSGMMTVYAVKYRGDGAVSGYDTIQVTTDTYNHLKLAGSEKPVFLSPPGVYMTFYTKYTYTDRELTAFRYVNKVERGDLVDRNYTFAFNGNSNPLYPHMLANPVLMRAVTQDVYPLPSDSLYPWLASQHYVSEVTFSSETQTTLTSSKVGYTYLDNTPYATAQTFPNLGIMMNYRYKIVQ